MEILHSQTEDIFENFLLNLVPLEMFFHIISQKAFRGLGLDKIKGMSSLSERQEVKLGLHSSHVAFCILNFVLIFKLSYFSE